MNCLIWQVFVVCYDFYKQLLIGLEVVVTGGKLKQTASLPCIGTELVWNRGPIWTQYAWKPPDKVVWSYW